MTKERFRKEDTGIALVIFNKRITPEKAAECMQGLPFKCLQNHHNHYLVHGKWRHVRQLKFKRLHVENLMFECDRKQVLSAAD